jgi:Acylphosphatases
MLSYTKIFTAKQGFADQFRTERAEAVAMEKMTARHGFISGCVQGVGFRWYARREAAALGLCGWVRNLPDGRVEIRFQGGADAVSRMEEWCRHGSPEAEVDRADLSAVELDGTLRSFEVR